MEWWRRIDPGGAELRATVAAMVPVLASFGSALLLERFAHLHAEVVVLAVALAVSLGRAERRSARLRRIVGLLLLPVVAIAASQVGGLMTSQPVLGDALFAVAVSVSIWLRRFGPRAAGAGTLLAMPFLAILITPIPLTPGDARSLWTAVVAAVALGWVVLTRLVAERTGLVPRPAGLAPPERAPAPAAGPGAVAGARVAGGSAVAGSRSRGRRRIAASDRMALQMGVALGLAFLLGHLAFPRHWAWVVITACIVSSGNRGRGDVVHKGVLRLVGAAAGTVAATLLGSAFPAGDTVAIVVIFAVLALGTWLRSISYAYWASCVTAVLALLYGYFGQRGAGLLGARLAGILLGAGIAVAAAWLVLPVRTTDVLRRWVADALAVLTDLLRAARHDPAGLHRQQARFAAAVRQLDQIAAPLAARRRLTRRWHTGPHHADVIDGIRRCVEPVATIARLGAADPGALARPDIASRAAGVALAVGAARRSLAGRAEPVAPGPAQSVPAPGVPAGSVPVGALPVEAGAGALERAFADLGAAVAALAAAIPAARRAGPPPEPPPEPRPAAPPPAAVEPARD